MQWFSQRFRRLWYAVGIVALISLAGSGCGVQQSVEAPKETLLVWHDWPEPQGDLVRQLVNEFMAIHANLTVVVEYVLGRHFRERFLAQANSGLSPDLVIGPELYILTDLVNSGFLQDLTQVDLNTDNLFPHTLEALKVDGRLYGIPFAAHTNILYYNKKLLRETSTDQTASPPQSLDDLLAKAQAGRRVALTTNFYHAYWGIKAFGGQMLDDKGQLALDHAYSKWLAWLVRAQEEPTMLLNHDYDTLFETFARGEAAYFVGHSTALLTLKERVGQDALGTSTLPQGKNEAGALMDLEAIAVSTQTMHPSLCFEMVEFLTNRVHQHKLITGDFGHIPVSHSLRFDSRLLPVAATLNQQIRHTSIVPLAHTHFQEELFAIGDEIYLQVLNGALDPESAPATALQRLSRKVAQHR